MTQEASPPRPAATVVVCRAHEAGGFELYLVKRHGRSGFMAGAHVFPGGRVDDDDAVLGATLPEPLRQAAAHMLEGLDDEAAAAYCVAAVRETAEECGLLLARFAETGAAVSAAVAERVVEEMRRGQGFRAALLAEGLFPDVAALRPLAWWITPVAEPKRFDTRFFLAPAPAGQSPRVDEHEATEGEWLSPSAALAAYASGRIQLAPPTLATLEDLAEHSDVERAAARVPMPMVAIEPKLLTNDDGLVLALPGDALHDVKTACSERRTRIILDENGRFCSRVVR